MAGQKKVKPKAKAGPLIRVAGYLSKYKTRIVLGMITSLLVSFANLFSLTAFVPIFDAIGEDGPVKLFQLTGNEQKKLQAYREGEYLEAYDQILVQWISFKSWANSKATKLSARELIFRLCLLIIPVYFLKVLFLTAAIYLIGTAGLFAVRDMRFALYKKLQELGLDYFEQGRTGFIMSRVINDVQLLARSLSQEFQQAVINIFYIVTHLALLAFISWEMLLVMLVAVPVLMSPVNNFASRIRKAAMGQQERLADMGAHVQEILSGIRVIRAFSMEKFEQLRFNLINDRLFRNTFKGHYYHQVGPAITEFVATIVVCGFLAWGAHEIAYGEPPLRRGEFFAFFFTLVFIMRPLKQVSVMLNLLGASSAAAERVFEIFDLSGNVKESENPLPFQGVEKEITFENVTFTYPNSDEPAVENINLTVKKGSTVSVVGSSGAGKSTMMDLLPRFYDPGEGAIKIDGTDIRDISIADLRRKIGIVTQSVFLFNATLKDNLTLGRTDFSQEWIEECAKAAFAHEFIEALPSGYMTEVGERGVMLSGGQRQRIAIARAILHDPPVLIFDEATSALDNESEQMVQKAIETLLKGRTVFIIAHRLSTVYRSDEILVMDKGRIAERGTHDDLLKSSNIYKKLYEMQFHE